MTPIEPHPSGPGAARDLRARQRYDECVAYTRESYRPETLGQCADELVAAWDERYAANRRFANMPDGAAFAGAIGEMYVAYAAATRDRASALAGVRKLQERLRERAPGDTATIERLRSAEAVLKAR